MPGYFPVLLDVRDKFCVVIGGGEVALRKVTTLVDRGARVRVISPDAAPGIKEMVERGMAEWEPREYQAGDLQGAFLCVAAADDPAVNKAVGQEARESGVLANLADDPEGSDYQVPSFFEHGPLLVAISTSGMSPAVARTLRGMIQSYLGESFGDALSLINDFRERVKHEINDAKARVRFWEEAVTPELLEQVRGGDLEAVKRKLEDTLARFKRG